MSLLSNLAFLVALISALSLQGCNTQKGHSRDGEAMMHKPSTPTVVDIAFMKGAGITQMAQRALGSNLKNALAQGGVEEAIPYCNLHAYTITDSMATKHQVALKRVASKRRNPNNAPSPEERRHLTLYAEMIANGDTLQPQLEALPGNQFLYTRPILTQGMCLTCHGQPNEEIKPGDLALIQSMYPQDSATGFEFGQLRGAWSVTFTLDQLQAWLEGSAEN